MDAQFRKTLAGLEMKIPDSEIRFGGLRIFCASGACPLETDCDENGA